MNLFNVSYGISPEAQELMDETMEFMVESIRQFEKKHDIPMVLWHSYNDYQASKNVVVLKVQQDDLAEVLIGAALMLRNRK